MSPGLSIALALLLLVGCAVPPAHDSLKSAVLPPLIPVRDFVANTDSQSHYRVSPDGTKVAWKAVHGTQEEIFVRTLGKDDARNLGFDAQGYPFYWAQDSRRLLFVKDAGGNENFHLFVVDTDELEPSPLDITPGENTRVVLQRMIKGDPSNVLIAHNGRDRAVFDLYRLNLDTGEQTPVYENSGDVIKLVTDRRGRLRARVRQSETQRFLELPPADGQGWSVILSWTKDDEVQPLQFTAEGDAIWMVSNRGRDKKALVRLDVKTAEESVVYAHPEADIGRVHISALSETPVLVHAQPDYPHVEVLDAALRPVLASLRMDGPVGVHISSSDSSEQLITFDVKTDLGVEYFLYDRGSGDKIHLGQSASYAFADALSPMRPIQFHARDGLLLRGYLTVPQGIAGKPVPMVMLVHGGPFARDFWGYSALVQFLTNRGYAVLQVNYRGSSGYGRTFMEAAIGEFAGTMHDDLIDGVSWAVEQGIADAKRIAIMGGSYGGYATLVGLTMTPEIFACGIDIVGPADLEALTRNFPPYWAPFMHRWYKYLGEPDNAEDRERMRAKSPLHFADRLVSPVLIIQGANDVRVKQDQSDRMVEALIAAGKPVEYLVIEGEGHRIRHWKNRLKVYRATEDFLADCLGGRSSGFDYYQLGGWLF